MITLDKNTAELIVLLLGIASDLLSDNNDRFIRYLANQMKRESDRLKELIENDSDD